MTQTLIMLCVSYSIAELQTICREFWNRMIGLEGDKYDLERGEKLKKFEVKTLITECQNLSSLPTKTTNKTPKHAEIKILPSHFKNIQTRYLFFVYFATMTF